MESREGDTVRVRGENSARMTSRGLTRESARETKTTRSCEFRDPQQLANPAQEVVGVIGYWVRRRIRGRGRHLEALRVEGGKVGPADADQRVGITFGQHATGVGCCRMEQW